MAAALDLRFTSLEENLLRRQLAEGWRSPLTSSAGRLFDAVAAALGICRRRTYEGQPAVELEMLASETETGYYPGEVTTAGNLFILNTVGLFRAGVEAGLAGGDLAVIAARFHHSLAQLLAQTCLRLREQTGLNLVALSGGVFQNARLLGNLQQRLISLGFEVLSHRHTPPNDGCISLGQVAVAAARLQ
jgi:hydrogenase maturation protein HypF